MTSPSGRPAIVTAIGILFIAAGLVGIAYHLPDVWTPGSPRLESVWVLLLRLLAVAGGVFVLRGANWARWLVIAWLAYHVVLSTRHSTSEVLVHAVLLGAVGSVLFATRASGYFRRTS